MEAELHGRQDDLLRGPMWTECAKADIGIPIKARVNVACVGRRAVGKRADKMNFSKLPVIQNEVLSTLADKNKDGRYWIKVDGTDLKIALQESMSGEWNGDVDLGDGQLQELRTKYDQRRAELSHGDTQAQLVVVIDNLREDETFLLNGLKKAVDLFHTKYQKPNTPEGTLKNLSWDILEYQGLLQKCRDLLQDLEKCKSSEIPSDELRSSVQQINKDDYQPYLTNLFKKKRSPASHILAVMVSEERRNVKPYATAVQYIPYASLTDSFIRELTSKVKKEMAAVGLNVVGTTTDGEFNKLRTVGSERPLHVIELIRQSKAAAEKLSQKALEEKLIPIGATPDGLIIKNYDPAVPIDVLQRVLALIMAGHTKDQAISELRSNLVPPGHTSCSFQRYKPETYLHKLRSLMATYLYRKSINDWMKKGIDFSQHLYVPEVDPATGITHHDRADHCHLLKRIATHTRELRYHALSGEAFDRAMRDPNTGLTHAALVGARKQDVKDAERLLSFRVAEFLEGAGYELEARYVRTVAEWHEATDGRGLTQHQRSQKNYAMLSYLLEDWMPWHQDTPDFRAIDINRPLDTIRGFSRETLIEVTCNIESQEHRRKKNAEVGYQEHPRSGTTDDVECFFSVCHRYLGDTFTLKEFKHRFKKLSREFCKQLDDDLPFYYFTPSSRRHHMESFDHVDSDEEKEQRLHRFQRNRREDPSIFTAGRAFLPARNRPSIRQRLHRFDVGLPPLSTQD